MSGDATGRQHGFTTSLSRLLDWNCALRRALVCAVFLPKLSSDTDRALVVRTDAALGCHVGLCGADLLPGVTGRWLVIRHGGPNLHVPSDCSSCRFGVVAANSSTSRFSHHYRTCEPRWDRTPGS
jgi:hypothetical protein